MRRRLPAGFDVDTHFNPSYEPWDQRMCIIPDHYLFDAISAGGVLSPPPVTRDPRHQHGGERGQPRDAVYQAHRVLQDHQEQVGFFQSA